MAFNLTTLVEKALENGWTESAAPMLYSEHTKCLQQTTPFGVVYLSLSPTGRAALYSQGREEDVPRFTPAEMVAYTALCKQVSRLLTQAGG